jgi:hypothetical protein
MKKILLTATLLLSTILSFSQTKFGIKGGLNFANMEVKGNDYEDIPVSPSSRTSFHIGGFAEIGMGSTFVFQPGLLLSGKGSRIDYSAKENGYSASIDATLALLYLELPLNFVAKFDAGKGKFLLGAGPYAGYAIDGKATGRAELDGPGTADDMSTPLNEDIKFGHNPGEEKPFDLGINLLTGYELKNGLLFNAGYGFGLINLSNEGGNNSEKNKVLSLSVGFKF